MKTLAHLSDLHFGREDGAAAEALLRDLAALRPDVAAVSGDLTQRALPVQFRVARAFLDRLPCPAVVVPGNHDIPLFDLARRFLAPLGRFAHYFGPLLEPSFEDDELLVLGVVTARSSVWKAGRISVRQIEALSSALRAHGEGRLRVLVAHHPFTAPPGRPGEGVAGRSARALRALAGSGLDLLLTGHLHRGSQADVRDHYPGLPRSVLALHAGSAISVRRRGEPNAYNLVTADGASVTVEARAFEGAAFRAAGRERWRRTDDGWRREPSR